MKNLLEAVQSLQVGSRMDSRVRTTCTARLCGHANKIRGREAFSPEGLLRWAFATDLGILPAQITLSHIRVRSESTFFLPDTEEWHE